MITASDKKFFVLAAFGWRLNYFLRILQFVFVFVFNLFILCNVSGDEFSFQLFDYLVNDNTTNDGSTDNKFADDKFVVDKFANDKFVDDEFVVDEFALDQKLFYRCSDKTNIVTKIPHIFNEIDTRLASTVTNYQSSNRKVTDRLFGGREFGDKSLRTWVSVFGNWTSVGGGVNSDDVLTFYSSGFAVGVDRLFDRRFLFGLTFGWDKTIIKYPRLGKENISNGHGHLYFRTIFRRIYFDVECGIGLGDGSQFNHNGLPQHTKLQWNFQIETGTWWEEGLTKIEPFLLLQHALLREKSLHCDKSAAIAGVRCSWQSEGLFAVSTPRIYGGLICDFGDSGVAATSLFSDSPAIFITQNRQITRTRFFGGCGTTASMGSTLEVYFRYTAEAASNYTSHTLLIGMNWIF
jgi:uncharacterized protein with beta-barrel porin domain